jgi:hypothetical protein
MGLPRRGIDRRVPIVARGNGAKLPLGPKILALVVFHCVTGARHECAGGVEDGPELVERRGRERDQHPVDAEGAPRVELLGVGQHAVDRDAELGRIASSSSQTRRMAATYSAIRRRRVDHATPWSAASSTFQP